MTPDGSFLIAGGLVGIAATSAALVRSRRDAVAALTLFLTLLVAFPAKLVIGPLGGIGQPSLLVALAVAVWWMAARSVRDGHLDIGAQPVRYAALALGWVVALGWAVARLGPLDALERNESTRTVLVFAAMIGVLLVAADGIRDRDRLHLLVRRLVAAGTFLAALGWVQFFTGVDPARWLQLPGLGYTRDFSGVLARSIFNRPSGTAMHPIEFGVVLGALLPVAIHCASSAPAGRRVRSLAPVLIIGPAVGMSVSRSGVISLLIGLVVLGSAWNWRRRLNAVVALVAATAVMWALVPGLIGTLKGLFSNYEDDPSVQGRLDDVPLVVERVWEQPLLGGGTGTFSHQADFPVDNQFFETAMENGLVGVVVTMFLFLTGFVVARKVGRLAPSDEDRHLGYALAGSILALGISAYTFSAFFYRIYLGLLFLLIGCAGALWRLSLRETAAEETPATTTHDAQRATSAGPVSVSAAPRAGTHDP